MVNNTRDGAVETLQETQEETTGAVETLAEAILDTGSNADNATTDVIETVIAEVDEGADELIEGSTPGGGRRYMRTGVLVMMATAIVVGVLAGMYLRRRASAPEPEEDVFA